VARSTYIYLVQDGEQIIAAFTVKYEAVEFIESKFIGGRVLQLYRMLDGKGSTPKLCKGREMREYWLFEPGNSRLEGMPHADATMQLIQLGGKILTSFNKDEQHVVYGISLPAGEKEHFERVTGYELSTPTEEFEKLAGYKLSKSEAADGS